MFSEYVKITNAYTYFNTGITPKTNTKIIAEMEFADYTGNVSFGTNNSNDSNDYRFFNYSKGFIFDCVNQRMGLSSSFTLSLNTKYKIEVGNCYVKVLKEDGTTFKDFSKTALDSINISSTIKIGGEASGQCNKCSIYRFTIYEGDTIVKDYFPRYYGGTYVLYDTISNTNLYPQYFSSGYDGTITGSPTSDLWNFTSTQLATITLASRIAGGDFTNSKIITKSELARYKCILKSGANYTDDQGVKCIDILSVPSYIVHINLSITQAAYQADIYATGDTDMIDSSGITVILLYSSIPDGSIEGSCPLNLSSSSTYNYSPSTVDLAGKYVWIGNVATHVTSTDNTVIYTYDSAKKYVNPRSGSGSGSGSGTSPGTITVTVNYRTWPGTVNGTYVPLKVYIDNTSTSYTFSGNGTLTVPIPSGNTNSTHTVTLENAGNGNTVAGKTGIATNGSVTFP